LELIHLAPYIGGAGLILAFIVYTALQRKSAGGERAREIARLIEKGSMAFCAASTSCCCRS
jgi:Na+/H+-translocating membrane pyrophosphatase